MGGESAEVSWDGVPSPDQKFVNIYRVIYHANSPNSIRDESSIFKISKIDSPKRLTLVSLQPNTDYQVRLLCQYNVSIFVVAMYYMLNGLLFTLNTREEHLDILFIKLGNLITELSQLINDFCYWSLKFLF